MPNGCCVTNCDNNYDKARKKSVFRIPKDRRELWLKKIPRRFTEKLSDTHTVVCEDHFEEKFLKRTISKKQPDGTFVTEPRPRPLLTKDAYPSIFPNCPAYLSETKTQGRRSPTERYKEIDARDDQQFDLRLQEDIIVDFEDFSQNFSTHISDNSDWMYRLQTKNGLHHYSFFQIHEGLESAVLVTLIRINADMSIKVFVRQDSTNCFLHVPDVDLEWCLQDGVLSCWTHFESLLGFYNASSYSFEDLSPFDQINYYCHGLEKVSEVVDEQTDDSVKEKLLFFVEQLRLLLSKRNRYSTEMLLWSFHIYTANKKAYNLLRDTAMTLPHASYLQRISSVFSVDSGLGSETQEAYLREKCKNLDQREKTVILMLDEIHVAHQMSYKDGKLEGAATDCSRSQASTAQVKFSLNIWLILKIKYIANANFIYLYLNIGCVHHMLTNFY